MAEECLDMGNIKRPVLVGTTTIKKSELLILFNQDKSYNSLYYKLYYNLVKIKERMGFEPTVRIMRTSD